MKRNEKVSDLKCAQKPTQSLTHTMQTSPAVEQNKNIKWSESPWNQSGRKGKGLFWLRQPQMTVVFCQSGLVLTD